MKPVFSIIVPVFNIEDYITTCIKSILHQTYQNFEVILVNDESSDNSGAICDLYASQFSNIKVIHQKNKGPSGARNSGVNEAIGDYLMFVDGDDFIPNNCLQIFYNEIEKTDQIDVIISSGLITFKQQPNLQNEKIINNTLSEDIMNGEKYMLHILIDYRKDIWNIFNKTYRTDFWKREKFNFIESIRCGEDLELIYKIIYKARKVTGINKITYYYRILRQNSIITSNNEYKLKNLILVLKNWEDFLKDKDEKLKLKFLSRLSEIYCTSILSQVYFFNKNSRKNLINEISKLKYFLNFNKRIQIKIIKYSWDLLGVNFTCKCLNIIRRIKKAIIWN